jgi:class 3 adenylate cyclase
MAHTDDSNPSQPASATAAPSVVLSQLRHDLRTPLNHVIGYAELLQEEVQERAADLLPDLGKIVVAAKQLLGDLDAAFALFEKIAHQDMPASSLVPPTVSALAGPGNGDSLAAPTESPRDGESRASILVVDDNETNRDVLARRLQRKDFDVHQAADGLAALGLIEQQRFDLILLDVMMPVMNGVEVLRRVRQRFTMSELPVIMATARGASEDVVQALEAGANDYVTKPVDVAILLARANTQLELKRSAEAIRNLAVQLEVRNRFIREAFGRYVTDEVVDNLLATPEGLALGGEARTVTILMSDLRGFSSLSEHLSPAQVVALLNNYLSVMTEVILKHEGVIDEFIGDGILVVFGAPILRPDHARRAVACAIEMQVAIQQVNAENARLGLPAVEMGIGINTGEVVVGNIGSNRRAKYAVVGRHMNLAARIEALTVGGQVLISESTREPAGEILHIRATTEVLLKGAKRPMLVHDVEGMSGDLDLWVPQRVSELQPLDVPIRVRLAILDGVHVAASRCDGEIVRLSRRACIIRTTAKVPLWTMLRLHVFGRDGGLLSDDVYGKVLMIDPAAAEFSLHFTSLPPEVELESLGARAANEQPR